LIQAHNKPKHIDRTAPVLGLTQQFDPDPDLLANADFTSRYWYHQFLNKTLKVFGPMNFFGTPMGGVRLHFTVLFLEVRETIMGRVVLRTVWEENIE
jgi:hypothetical protein